MLYKTDAFVRGGSIQKVPAGMQSSGQGNPSAGRQMKPYAALCRRTQQETALTSATACDKTIFNSTNNFVASII
jgi:hypothetical protein